MFGLNCILRYIMSHVYHLFVSERRIFWIWRSISCWYVIFDRLREMGYWVWEVKGIWMTERGIMSVLFGVRGWCLTWIASWDILWVIYTICLWAIWKVFCSWPQFLMNFFFICIYEVCPRSSHRSKEILKNLNVHISGSAWS